MTVAENPLGRASARAAERLSRRQGLFVDGAEVDAAGGGTFELESPVDGTVLCTVADGGEDDVRRAVEAARRAFDAGVWSGLEGRERSHVLRRIAAALAEAVDELAVIESLSIGRPVREMRAQLGRFAGWFEYFGALAETVEGRVPPTPGGYVNYVTRRALGVAGLITPWNHPIAIASKKIAPALAAGNCVVVKPSELAPVSVLELARICHEAGLPAGVLNVVSGAGPVAGRALAEHPGLGRVDFTGGTPTGRAVAAAAGHNLVPVSAELGGKAPVVVFGDTDVPTAVAGAAFAGFIASGQSCVQGSRVLVESSIYEDVLAGLVERARGLRAGHPLDRTTQFGPVVSRAHLERVSAAVDQAREQGATVACGGERLREPPLDRGCFYAPTLLRDVTPEMDCYTEEIFGPVLVALPFEDEDHAVQLANDARYGLAASVWTSDVARAHRVADRLDVGMVWVNTHHRTDPASPWGGTKDSGIGREQGLQAYHMYTETKSVMVPTESTPFDWYADDGEQRLN